MWKHNPGRHAALEKPQRQMKTRKLTSVIAIGSILPLAAWGQSSGSSQGTTSQGSGTTTDSTWRQGDTAPRAGSSSAGQAGSTSSGSQIDTTRSGTAGGWDRSGTSTASVGAQGQLQRVSQDQLDQRLTANSLIGKKIVDRDGNDVGTVKDIGLAAVLPQHLNETGAATASSSTDMNRSTTTGTSTTGTSGSSIAGTGSVGSSSEYSNPSMQSGSARDVNVYVEVGGFLGMGGDLVAIPASQLQRDASEDDQFKVNLSQDDIQQVAQRSSDEDTATGVSTTSE